MNSDTPIQNIPRISDKYAGRLKRLGIKTLGHLFFHFPHRYDDFSQITPISQIKLGDDVCVKGRIIQVHSKRTARRGINVVHALIQDNTSAIRALWFNQSYLAETLNTKREVCLAGKVQLGKEGLFISNPIYEKLGKNAQIHTGRLVPVYPSTEGVSSRWLRYIIHPLLKKYIPEISETLPEEIIKAQGLMNIQSALWQMHFPDSLELAEQARYKFSFEELLFFQLAVLSEKKSMQRKASTPVPFHEEATKKFVNALAFKLTDAQRKTAWQILKDMQKEKPMSRLLQGDVGSGKTVVAAIAALNTGKQGFQATFMAPTGILAHQHFKEFCNILNDFDITIALFTREKVELLQKKKVSKCSKKELLEKIKNGKIQIIIGTHSLIQKGVEFKKLALIIIDEQHRFGVDQRSALRNNTPTPHLLSMTATPIPRSLALTAYGDLDMSIIDEMPKGRKEIKTKIVLPRGKKDAYKTLEKEIKKGHQAFVICPRISSPEEETNPIWQNVQSVEQEYENLAKDIFPDFKLAMLHGQLEPENKQEIMKNFKAGKIDVLVSTSVVEVGVDVPNATAMIIQGAERFGLAQLHQFRGRIGRSKHQAYCFLFITSIGETAEKRLDALVESNDGFYLAEKDLEIRGPGDFLGARQAGMPDLVMSSLSDIKLVQKARKQAKDILERSPLLNHYPKLKNRLSRFDKIIHLE